MNSTDRSPPGGIHLDLKGPDLTEVAQARRFARDFLAGSPEGVIEVAQLLTSELVSNAMEHARGVVRVSLDCVDGILRVRVKDGSPRHPVMRQPLDLEETRGRGLLLVESLALSWGVLPDLLGGGKTVWFKLRTD